MNLMIWPAIITYIHTLITLYGHLNFKQLQKSFKATWHSSIRASAQSRREKVKAKWGLCGVAGHSSALAKVIGRGSQGQVTKTILCSIPIIGTSL